ncbi:MAG TPA: outer membrane lipoprotein-sorting protein [Candidatus Marinimicrobia bacterium]|nr:outer membrane lipoprotein-sorting protein [Candidatus Neomarinimicrobiota bacterium]
MKKRIIGLTIFLALNLWAQNPDGHSIMMKVYERPTGQTILSDLTMSLTNSRGDLRERTIQQFLKDFGDHEKKIMFFKAPADVRNTSFMNWSYDSGQDDDQWIYLPALKKVKRIASDSKSDYFMGSDFTYDDLGERHPDKDDHKILREETLNGENCYVIESRPKDDDNMYSHTITWIIKDKWIGLKKEFYDEDGEHLKTLNIQKYEQISGYWVIPIMEMHNVQKDHRTRIEMKNIKINQAVDDGIFTERMMQRGVR